MKKIMSVLMVFAMLFSMCNVAFASGAAAATTGANAGTGTGNGNGGTTTAGGIPSISPYSGGATTLASKVLGFVQFVAYAIALGMLIYVGIKYVMASANEKADLKSALVKYVIGAIIIAGASTILGWVMGIGA